MIDLSHIDLLRLRRTEAESISRWLNDENAVKEFNRAIRIKLRRFPKLTRDNAETIYIFGREMRKIFDERKNQDLVSNFVPDDIEPAVGHVFTAGFLKWSYDLLLELVASSVD